MRLTTVILIVSLMQVSANTFGQHITLSKKNVALETVLREIRKQSGFDIIFDGKTIPKYQLISVDISHANIDEVMKSVLKDLPLTYTIEDKIVSIKKKPKTSVILTDKITVRGKVLDEKGMPLAGASVFVEGDKHALASTNLRGEFVLLNVEANAIVIIAYMGYDPINLPAKADMGTIRMVLSMSKLSEVQIIYNTGYQQISRERSAGSFAKPDLNVMLNRTSTPNILTRLEGLVPGLTTRGPGGLLVRGQSSIPQVNSDSPILTSTRPLIVVDGIEFEGNIEQINMQDVEDINVLKDATSASIWGAKAANGVIVITTKRGKAGEKIKIDYDGYYAFQGRKNLDYVPRLNSQQFISLSRELFPQALPFYPDWRSVDAIYGNLPHLQIQYDRARGLISQQHADSQLDSLASLSNTGQIGNFFTQNAATINQTVSISGGGKVHSFYGSINHIGSRSDTAGIQRNQYKINLSNVFTFSKRVTVTVNADLTNTVTKMGNSYIPARDIVPYQMFRDANGNPLNINYLSVFNLSSNDPTVGVALPDSVRAIYQARSRVNLDYNPVLDQDRARTSSNGLFARLVGNAKVNILKGLDFVGTYGYNLGNTNTRQVWDQNLYNMRVLVSRFTTAANTSATPVYNIPNLGGQLNVSTSSYKSWTLRNQLLFNHEWNRHQLTVMAGQQATSNTPVSTTGIYYGWDDQLQTSTSVNMAMLNAGVPGQGGTQILAGNNVGGGEGRIARTTSYFANVGYTFDRKYTLNGSWRIDESNLFGKDKSAQNRPVYSIGGKWALGFEDWMKPLSWLNRLDVRLTYGITGNAPFSGAASSYDILTASSNVNYVTGVGYLLSSPANTKLTWERTNVYNAGFDFAILNNRLSGSIDAYVRKTRDLIGALSTSPFTGYPSVIGNFGDMENKGVDIGLNSTNIQIKNFTWSTGLTFSYNKNKLTKLQQNPPASGDVMVNTDRMVGYPLNTFFAYNYAGLNSVGDPQVRLVNGTVTAANNVTTPADILYMGTRQPVWSGGLQNNFQYKSFGLSASIIYSGGNVMTNNINPASNESVVGYNSYQLGFLDRWKVPGDENRTDIPRYVPSAELQNARNIRYYSNSQRSALNGSYAKLRDITLSYRLPKTLVSRLNAQAISFRLQVNNLLLWTANKQGMDPEAIGQTRDAQGTVSLGAHVTF